MEGYAARVRTDMVNNNLKLDSFFSFLLDLSTYVFVFFLFLSFFWQQRDQTIYGMVTAIAPRICKTLAIQYGPRSVPKLNTIRLALARIKYLKCLSQSGSFNQ